MDSRKGNKHNKRKKNRNKIILGIILLSILIFYSYILWSKSEKKDVAIEDVITEITSGNLVDQMTETETTTPETTAPETAAPETTMTQTTEKPTQEVTTNGTIENTTIGVVKDMHYDKVSYYIDQRAGRYETYGLKHADLNANQVVLNVNMNLDYSFYTHIQLIANPDDLLVLCNKSNQLPSDFTPQNLVSVPDGYYVNDGKSYQLDGDALDAFMDMSNAAKADGITLKIISAYRSFNYQANLYEKYKNNNGKEAADRFSARPGHSEHETGLAMDINEVSSSFENTAAYRWLQEHAQDNGFILRYPKNKENTTGYMYESWHYRFVGIETAKLIKSKNITFDEYAAMYLLSN